MKNRTLDLRLVVLQNFVDFVVHIFTLLQLFCWQHIQKIVINAKDLIDCINVRKHVRWLQARRWGMRREWRPRGCQPPQYWWYVQVDWALSPLTRGPQWPDQRFAPRLWIWCRSVRFWPLESVRVSVLFAYYSLSLTHTVARMILVLRVMLKGMWI